MCVMFAFKGGKKTEKEGSGLGIEKKKRWAKRINRTNYTKSYENFEGEILSITSIILYRFTYVEN